jgi:hypothetical protein
MIYKRTNLRKREAFDVWLPIAMAVCGDDLTDRERYLIRTSFKLGWDARAIDEKAPKDYVYKNKIP